MKEFVAFQNGIKEEGMRSLLEGLASNNELEVLKINDNIIKDTSFIELQGLINKLNKLKVIDLSDSGLGGENSLEIFNSLIKIDSLEEVYLNYNEIEEKEIQLSIADSLSKRKNKLKKLVLRGNEIKKSVFSRIASFQKVDELDCFSESEADEEEIQEMMRKMNIDK
jgi:Ran GTPase-activating protein 1